MMIEVQRACDHCGRTYTLTVDADNYEKWAKRQGLIQDLLPNLTAGERELLISGTCNSCFNKLFPPELE